MGLSQQFVGAIVSSEVIVSNLVNYNCFSYLVRYCSKLISELVTSGHHLFSRCNLVAPKGLLCRGVQNLCSSGVRVCPSVRVCCNPFWTRNLDRSRLVLDGSRVQKVIKIVQIDQNGP